MTENFYKGRGKKSRIMVVRIEPICTRNFEASVRAFRDFRG